MLHKRIPILMMILCLMLPFAAMAESDADAENRGGEDMLFFSTAPQADVTTTSSGGDEDDPSSIEEELGEDLFFSGTAQTTPSAESNPAEEPEEEGGQPMLSLSVAEENWNWQSSRQTAVITLTNEGDGTAREILLTLTPVTSGTRELAQPVFLKDGGKNLSSKEQQSSYTLPKLLPGRTAELTVGWMPSFNLISVQQADLAVQASCNGVSAITAALHVEKPESGTGIWEAMLIGRLSVGMFLCAVAGLTVIFALWAMIRSLIWNKNRNTWIF